MPYSQRRMSNRRVPEALLQAVRQILWEKWDPIGVNDCPGARDEYDSYAGTVCRRLMAGVGVRDLDRHLAKLETESMGLPQRSSEARAQAVLALLKLAKQ